jgi:hypothetical protein
MSASDGFDQRAFTGAVLAEEGVDFAGLQIEVDAAQRAHTAVALHEAAEFEQGGGRHAGENVQFRRPHWQHQPAGRPDSSAGLSKERRGA